MPRWVLVLLGAVVVLVTLVCLLGLRLAVLPDTVHPVRERPLDLLDSGDLLFFNSRVSISSVLDTFCRLLSKGALGTPYCHVSVVYRDVRGLFGPANALYSFEYCSSKGGPLLFPLRKKAGRSLGRLLVRELREPRPPIDRDALDAFVLDSTEKTREGRSPHGAGAWTKSMVERHLLFLCPDPRNGGTCADHVVRFLEAAGLWAAEEACFCTSVTDLLSGDDSTLAGLPPLAPPELVKRIGKTKERGVPR